MLVFSAYRNKIHHRDVIHQLQGSCREHDRFLALYRGKVRVLFSITLPG